MDVQRDMPRGLLWGLVTLIITKRACFIGEVKYQKHRISDERTQNERHAYAASPNIYKARRYLEVLVKGLAGARKYFLAFDPKDRNVKVRFETQEMDGPDFTQMSLESEGQ